MIGQLREIRVPSAIPHCLRWSSKRLFTKHCYLQVNCLPPVWSPKTPIPYILFCLWLKMVFKVRVSPILVSYSVFLGLFHVDMLLKFEFLLGGKKRFWILLGTPTPPMWLEQSKALHGRRKCSGQSPPCFVLDIQSTRWIACDIQRSFWFDFFVDDTIERL